MIVSSSIHAATMHAIIVGDTQSNIGNASTIDLGRIKQHLQTVSYYTDMELIGREYSSFNFRAEKVMEYIDSLTVDDDDVIVFYYTGHGFRTPSMDNPWPALFFGFNDDALDIHAIANILAEKNPRFLLVIADCCNNLVEESDAPTVRKNAMFSLRKDSKAIHGYRKLFCDFHGVVVASSAEAGEYALCNNAIGGFFTYAYLESEKNEIQNPEPTWEALLTRAKSALDGLEQTPQYLIFDYMD